MQCIAQSKPFQELLIGNFNSGFYLFANELLKIYFSAFEIRDNVCRKARVDCSPASHGCAELQ